MRKWKWVITYILSIIICWGAVSSYFPIHFKTKEVPADCIKFLTYNVMQFEFRKPHTKKKPNEIIQYIIDSKADIVCLQEYGSNIKGKKSDDVSEILKMYPYSRKLNLKSWPDKNQIFGLAIFSKFPIESFEEIPFESEFNGSFMAELNINGKKTTIINNHLESNKLSMEERNEYYSLTKDFDSHKLDILTTKMANRLTPAFKKRAEQAHIIKEYIAKNKNPYLIVCGDFNDTPISYSRHTIKGNLKDAFAETGTGLGISYNSFRFLFRIDYIFYSKNIKSYNCTVDRKIKKSDHYPVWTYLQFE